MKSVENFEAAGYPTNQALQYSFLGFFAGSLLTHLLDVALESISARYGLNVPTTLEPVPLHIDEGSVEPTEHNDNEGFSASSPRTRKSRQVLPGDMSEFSNGLQTCHINSNTDPPPEFATDTAPSSGRTLPHERPSKYTTERTKVSIESDPKELLRMGIFSAVVIFLHNLPEGLATYVSVIADPYAGAAVAFAIALHNIPEASRTLRLRSIPLDACTAHPLFPRCLAAR
jgi:zinc transporter ZupT